MMNFICLILRFEFIILIFCLDKMDYYYFGKFGENLIFGIFEKLKLREVDSNWYMGYPKIWECMHI
jgi:hypothetical protein